MIDLDRIGVESANWAAGRVRDHAHEARLASGDLLALLGSDW